MSLALRQVDTGSRSSCGPVALNRSDQPGAPENV